MFGLVTLPTVISQSMPIIGARPKMLLVSAVALIDTDGRVLLNQRPASKSMAGLWEFPGGKIEKNESPNECIIREVREELGVDISNSCFSPLTFTTFDYEDFSVIIFLYLSREWEGFIKGKENQNLKWVRPNEMFKINMLPADIPLISFIRDNVS